MLSSWLAARGYSTHYVLLIVLDELLLHSIERWRGDDDHMICMSPTEASRCRFVLSQAEMARAFDADSTPMGEAEVFLALDVDPTHWEYVLKLASVRAEERLQLVPEHQSSTQIHTDIVFNEIEELPASALVLRMASLEVSNTASVVSSPTPPCDFSCHGASSPTSCGSSLLTRPNTTRCSSATPSPATILSPSSSACSLTSSSPSSSSFITLSPPSSPVGSSVSSTVIMSLFAELAQCGDAEQPVQPQVTPKKPPPTVARLQSTAVTRNTAPVVGKTDKHGIKKKKAVGRVNEKNNKEKFIGHAQQHHIKKSPLQRIAPRNTTTPSLRRGMRLGTRHIYLNTTNTYAGRGYSARSFYHPIVDLASTRV
jgi:hypothetical protein